MATHRFGALITAGTALTGVALLPGTPVSEADAHAATATCEGSQTVAYSPGLSSEPRQVTIHGTSTLSHCASSADPRVTAARSSFHATGRLSCTEGAYLGTRRISWNNGRTSTLSFHAVLFPRGRASVAAIRGVVTSGQFDGQKWSADFTVFATRPRSCATTAGLTTASGRLLLGIGSPVPGRKAPEKPTFH
jgi:hypothetical protein